MYGYDCATAIKHIFRGFAVGYLLWILVLRSQYYPQLNKWTLGIGFSQFGAQMN